MRACLAGVHLPHLYSVYVSMLLAQPPGARMRMWWWWCTAPVDGRVGRQAAAPAAKAKALPLHDATHYQLTPCSQDTNGPTPILLFVAHVVSSDDDVEELAEDDDEEEGGMGDAAFDLPPDADIGDVEVIDD